MFDGFDAGDSTHGNRTATGGVSIANAASAENLPTGGKVWAGDVLHQFQVGNSWIVD